MTILLQCDKCWCRFATKHKSCPKCGAKVTPLRRRFVVEARDASGKKRVKTLGCVTPEESRIAEIAFKQEIRLIKSPKQTVYSICEAYINKIKAQGRVYASDVDHRLCIICKHLGKDTDVLDVTVQHVDSLRGQLLQLGLARATVDRYFAAGRAAWNYSVEGVNPWKKAGMLNPDNKITRYLSETERERLLLTCQQVSRQLYEIVFVALGTGLRKSEILQLRRQQVDFAHDSISVVAKGNKRRLIYPAQSVMRLLQDIQDNGSDYFWLNEDGRPHNAHWKYAWRKALRLADLPHNFRFHDLRHDAATRAYAESGDIYMVSQMLGHSEISVTMRYAHLDKKKIQKAFGTIDPKQ